MAILDTFYLLFKSDTKELKKGAQEAEKVVDNLNSSLSKSGKISDQLGSSFLKMASSATALFAAAIPASFFAAGIKVALELGTELSKTSRVMNVNIEDLQAWGNAVELAGGDAKAFQGTLSSLSEKFGTSAQQTLALLPRYANALSKLSPSRGQQVGKMLGLDEGTILLLQQGSREVDNMVRKQKQLNVITEQNKELYLKYDKSLIGVKQSFNGLFAALAIEMLPMLIKIADTTKEWVQFFVQHKDFVIGGFYAISAAIAAVSIRFALLNPIVSLIAAGIAGLIALFALVYDDVKAFMNGQRSMIGYFINHYPKAAQAVYSSFKLIRDYYSFLGRAAEKLLHPVKTLNEALSYAVEKIKQVQSYLGNKLGFNMEEKNKYVIDEKINAMVNQTNAAGMAGRSGGNVSVGDVTINTQATDAKGISQSLHSRIDQEMQQVANYHADGVVA